MITDKIKINGKLTATVLVLCMILSGFTVFSVGMYGNTVLAIPIDETGEGGTLIWNDTYFLTDPVDIMLPNIDDDLTNHYPTVYKDKVAWTENIEGYDPHIGYCMYQSIVYYNMTTGIYEYINGTYFELPNELGYELYNITLFKPVLLDNYLISLIYFSGYTNNGQYGLVFFDYTDLNYTSELTVTLIVDLLATDFYDANNEYVTWIDTNDKLNVLDLSTLYETDLFGEPSPTINQYNEMTTFVLSEQNLRPFDNPSINENNDIIFPFTNSTNLNENYGMIKFNADTEEWEVLMWEEYITPFFTDMKWYGMYRNDIWFGYEVNDTLDLYYSENLKVFDVETDEMLYETDIDWDGDPIAGGYYPLGFDGMIGTGFLSAYTDDNWTNYRDELQLINLETGENYTIKQVWNDDISSNYMEDYIPSTTTRYNVYAYANGSYAIVDCNYAFNPPTRSYDPDGISPSIMVMFLHPIDEEVDESVVVDETNIYVVLQGTLIALFVQLILPLIIIMIVIRMVMNIMKDTTKGKKKK